MKNVKVIIGSRGSDLALWQARWVQQALTTSYRNLHVSIEIIKTTGDKILDSPLSKIGDKGLFTKEIEQALMDRKIDLAVHSLKDLPTQLPNGLTIGAITKREDPRDVFIPHPENSTRTLLDQAPGAVIATGSLRRRSQLLHLRPDFVIEEIRGNLNTRLKKLDESQWAGMILAKAGVVRLGWENRIGEVIEASVILPAVGQGALGIEIREGDERILKLISSLHHYATAQAAIAERALLRTLEGGCQVPIGTHGRVDNEGDSQTLLLNALVGSIDGSRVVQGNIQGHPSKADALGRDLAETLLAGGANDILRAIRVEHPVESPE